MTSNEEDCSRVHAPILQMKQKTRESGLRPVNFRVCTTVCMSREQQRERELYRGMGSHHS